MAPQAGRQQGGPGAQFRSTATTSHALARPQGAAQTPLHHSSSSIYDNDDETEAVLALAFGQTSDEGKRFVDLDRDHSPPRPEKDPQWGADEYGFRDPPSPSPTTSTRLPRSGFLTSATRRQGGHYVPDAPYSPSALYDPAYAGMPHTDHSADAINSAGARLPRDQGVRAQAGSSRSVWQANAQTTQRSRGFAGVIKPMPVRAANSTQFSQPARQQQQRPAPSTRAQLPRPSQAVGPVARMQQQPRAMPAYSAEEDEEAEYWRDDPFEAANGEQGALGDAQDFEEALITAEQSAREAMARSAPVNRPAVSQKRPQQDVRHLEDLEAVGNETSAARLPQAGLRKQSVKLKPVSSLPDMFRSLWRFGVFNAVQSTCFDSVYGSDENVVISAPTGAGKTVLFELAMLRLFTTSSSPDAKVLYMAPTKSLCSERVTDWKKKFEVGLGWTVQELTGDSDYSSGAWRDVAKARIIVTTPEKWDAMTRKWHDHGTTLGQLRLFCIDEVHSVGSDRGAVLEVVVSRMKTLGTSTRFVAVSATVPNIADVAEWLGSDSADDKPAKVFQFGDDFRPCKLQKVVLGYPRGSNDFAFANSLSFKLYDLIKQYSSGKPVLVFCNTRKSCTQAAEALLKSYKEAVASNARRDILAWPKPCRGEYKTGDKSLSALLEYGIAVHHAGMEMNDRKLVERLFIDGKISIVCSTSTLAVGVNLPARMVIIRGTKSFADGAMREYTDLEVLQMIGRAGRPQFDTLGVAVIMTEKGSESKYSDLVNAQTRLESCLHNSLTEHVNSEIALGTIQDIGSALHWLRSTFLFVRITKNCAFYGLGKDTASPEQRLEEICLRAVDQLVQSGVVEREEDTLVANQYGDIMSRFYISHETFLAIKTLPLKSGMRTLLETISNASEMSSYRFRQGEKSLLLKLNKGLKFPTSKVATTADRVMILIQLALEGVPGSELKIDSTNPMLDLRSIFVAATRIAKCMIDVAIAREDGGIRTMLELLRSLNGRGWDNSALVLRQLEGIGEKSYKALASAGITSIDDVRNADADRLQIILSRKPPYGHKLISQARSIPQFELALVSKDETTRSGTGVQVDLTVDLRLKQSKPLPVTKRGGVKFWATVATTTSDNEFIDFRRARLDQLLNQPKQFDLSVVLVKPSQKLVLSVSCEHIAGSEVKLVIKPETPAHEFPLPSLDLQDDLDDPGDATSECVVRYDPRPDSSAKERAGQKAGKSIPKKARLEAPGSGPAQRRPNGKYECNHACGDKTKCKHLCCREGLDKPPAQRKSAGQGGRAAKPAAAVADTAPKPPPKRATRLKPLASTGVALSLNASGKAVAREIASDEDELDSSSSSLEEEDRAGASANIGRKLANQSHRARNVGSSALHDSSLDVFASPSPPREGAKTVVRSTSGDPRLKGNADDFAEPKEPSLRRPKQVRRAGDRTESSKRLRLSSPQAESARAAESRPALSAADTRHTDTEFSSSQDDAAGLFLPSFTDDAEMVDEGITNTTLTDMDPFADLRAGSPDLRDGFGDDEVTKLTPEGAKQANCRPEDDAQLEEPAAEEPTNEEDDFDAWLDSNVLVV